MAACASCLKSICCCHDAESVEKIPLIDTPCIFERGIHANVTIEIGEGCQIVSMKPASKEVVNLCDPCPADIGSEQGAINQYDTGYAVAKETYYDIGRAEGYAEGREAGVALGESEGYAKGYPQGDDDGFTRGLAQGASEVDCDVKYNEGYNSGYDDAKDEQPSSADDILAGLNIDQAQQVSYIDINGDGKVVVIRQDSQGNWVSDDDAVVADPDTGSFSIDANKVQPGSTIIIETVEIDNTITIITECNDDGGSD